MSHSDSVCHHVSMPRENPEWYICIMSGLHAIRVYQDFDKWEGSTMAGTLDYSPPVDHIEPSRSSGYY